MWKYIFLVLTIVPVSLSWQDVLLGDEVYLKNGDRITGEIIEQNSDTVSMSTEAMSTVVIRMDAVERIKGAKTEAMDEKIVRQEEVPWKKEVSVGYNKSSGNTQNSQLSVRIYANRKTDRDEFTARGDISYSSSNNNMDSQKWSGMLRYAFSLWGNKAFNFYKIETEHDRFANIDYRSIASAGAGYWFSDTPDWKAMVEAGLGVEYTNYRDMTPNDEEMVLVPRAFFEKTLLTNAKLAEDITFYPSLEDTGDFRLHSETSFTNPIDDNLSLRLTLIDDYNSHPADNAKKNDTRFISELTYSF